MAKKRQPSRKLSWIPMLLAIASVAIVIAGIAVLKAQNTPAPAMASVPGGALPADQLNQSLAQGKPVLVFMHSTSCQSCIDMMKVVDQVYPEFAGQVTLVDVNVYDDANLPLMQKLGLKYIPTVVVFNSQGQSWQNVGLMQPDQFRKALRERALGS
jgi:thioredoxin-like negative regulator of GroEL